MSLKAISAWVDIPIELMSATAFRVGAILADNHNEHHGGHAWVSVKEAADQLHCSERTVQRALSKLRDLGVIVPVIGHGFMQGVRAQYRPTVYRFDFEALAERVRKAAEEWESRGDTNVTPEIQG